MCTPKLPSSWDQNKRNILSYSFFFFFFYPFKFRKSYDPPVVNPCAARERVCSVGRLFGLSHLIFFIQNLLPLFRYRTNRMIFSGSRFSQKKSVVGVCMILDASTRPCPGLNVDRPDHQLGPFGEWMGERTKTSYF